MTTREYLGQIGELQKQITVNTEKLRILYEASYNTDRYDRKDNRSSITARPMKTNGVIGYDAIELQLKEDKERLIELKSQIMIELAMNLENAQHLEVIKLRYIDLKPWNEIVMNMRKSKRRVMQIAEQGIKQLEGMKE